eukprot:1201257-Rhodomonas_salina.2
MSAPDFSYHLPGAIEDARSAKADLGTSHNSRARYLAQQQSWVPSAVAEGGTSHNSRARYLAQQVQWERGVPGGQPWPWRGVDFAAPAKPSPTLPAPPARPYVNACALLCQRVCCSCALLSTCVLLCAAAMPTRVATSTRVLVRSQPIAIACNLAISRIGWWGIGQVT